MTDRLQLPDKKDIAAILSVRDKKLPSFPQVAAKLLKAANDEKASLQDLSKIVETDPGISVRILEIVNSALYGLKRKITVLSEAVVYLGLDEVKKLAFGMTVFEKLFKSGRSNEFDRLLFWRHCLSVALLSMEMAEKLDYPEPEEAYISGLLHDVGKIFLDLRGRKDYGQFITELSESTDQVIEYERSEIGLGHDDIGAFFCHAWKLPEKIALVVKYHHQPFGHLGLDKEEQQLISIVALADFLCWTQGIGSFNFIRPPVLPPEVGQTVSLEKGVISECMTRMADEIESISQFYHFAFPTAGQIKENLLEANLKLSRANTSYYYQDDPMIKAADNPRVRYDKMSPNMELELAKPLARAKSIKEVLDIVMYQIGHLFQPQHWSLLLKDQKTGDMVFSIVVGTNKQKLLGMKFPKGEGVAGAIMETGKSMIINDVDKDARFSARVDKFTGFKTRSIIGTPLKTEQKIFGVIELINRIDEKSFSEDDLTILTSIAEYAAIAIERSYYHQALTALATKDSVTGFKNRWSFERAVSNKDEVQKNYGLVFSLLIIEIKGLWQADSKSSSSSSEDVVKTLAKALNQTKRREDEVYRYGEETFVVILPQTYSDGADIAKERIGLAANEAAAQKDERIKCDISAYTIGAEDAGRLKQMVSQFLAQSVEAPSKDDVPDIDIALLELIKKEKKKHEQEGESKELKGKEVSLGGRFVRLKTGESGHMRVERLALLSIGFRIARSHRIRVNDFLDIHFTLDDLKKNLVERRIVVREINGNFVKADFYNPPPYAKNLGFYLMS